MKRRKILRPAEWAAKVWPMQRRPLFPFARLSFRRAVAGAAALAMASGLALAAPAATAQGLPDVGAQSSVPLGAGGDPLDTPQVRQAMTQGWYSLPKQVRDHVDVPAGSSKYIDTPTAPGRAPSRPQGPNLNTVNLQHLIDSAVARYGGSAAVAVSDGNGVRVFGDNRAIDSFSTIKVPLSVAALRHNPGNYGRARAAITYSDNAATTAMWNSIPRGEVDRVIAQAGSATARPASAWWGSTPWSTSQQAKFIANLPCVAGSRPVLDLMGQVIGGQRWGIGAIPGTKFKSGWASSNGRWHVRQMGRIPTSRGGVAVAVSTMPGSGTYADSVAMANHIAQGLRGELGKLPTSRCQIR